MSLPTLLFLRGGQQQDGETKPSNEGATLADADDIKNQSYGSDEDSGALADVEMASSSQSIEVESAVMNGAASNLPISSPRFLSVLAPASSLLRAATAFYTQQLTARPLVTKSLTAGIIFGMSDWCAQLIEIDGESSVSEAEEAGGKLVFSRILSSFLVGLLFFGPAANAWYSMIFKLLPSTSLISTLQKAALGQIFFGPTFTCVFFAAGMIQSNSFSPGAWLKKIQSDLPAVWASGLGFWPAVDFISYKMIPVQWIPLFVNFCSFVWTIYLSLVANRGKSVGE